MEDEEFDRYHKLSKVILGSLVILFDNILIIRIWN